MMPHCDVTRDAQGSIGLVISPLTLIYSDLRMGEGGFTEHLRPNSPNHIRVLSLASSIGGRGEGGGGRDSNIDFNFHLNVYN